MAAERRTSRKRTDESGGAERANPPRPEPAARPRPGGELIVVRHLGDQVGPDCRPGWWWVAEAYDDRPFPCGQAWVMVVPPDAPDRAECELTAQVFYVQVADDSRRKGVATRLVRAVLARWSEAELTGPISKGGQKLWAKFVRPPEPEDMYTPRAITRMRAAGMSRADVRALARG